MLLSPRSRAFWLSYNIHLAWIYAQINMEHRIPGYWRSMAADVACGIETRAQGRSPSLGSVVYCNGSLPVAACKYGREFGHDVGPPLVRLSSFFDLDGSRQIVKSEASPC